MSTVTLTIGGIDRTSLLRSGTMNVTSRLNSRDRAEFQLVTLAANRPQIGAEVLITDGGTRIFGGSIEVITEQLSTTNGLTLEIDCDCVSFDALADRRLVARAYDTPGQTLRDIVLDIIANDFAGDGINTTNVDVGPVLSKLLFHYQQANEVFDTLAELSGFSWWIDPFKNLYFKSREQIAAPYALTSASANFMMASVQSTRIDYRNRQYVKAGLGLTASRVEAFVGDGARKSFTTAYPVGAPPTSITVAAVAKTIGVKEVDTGKDWYYQIGSPVLSQDNGAAAVTNGTAISITYQGQYPILVAAQDDPAVANRVAVEGGSGYYDAVADEPEIVTVASAEDRAAALLRRYARIPRRLTIRTMTIGLRAGQLVSVNITQHGLTGTWLVESTQTRDRNGLDLEYSCVLLDGEAVGGWEGFFGALAKKARQIEYRENEVVLLLRSQPESVAITDTNSFTTAAPTAPLVGTAICGYSELTS